MAPRQKINKNQGVDSRAAVTCDRLVSGSTVRSPESEQRLISGLGELRSKASLVVSPKTESKKRREEGWRPLPSSS